MPSSCTHPRPLPEGVCGVVQGARARARWRLPSLQELRISMAAGQQAVVPFLGLLDGLPDSLQRLEIVCGGVAVFHNVPQVLIPNSTGRAAGTEQGALPQLQAGGGLCMEGRVAWLTRAVRLPPSCHAVVQTDYLALETSLCQPHPDGGNLLLTHLAAWVADTGAASVRFRCNGIIADAQPPHEAALIRVVSRFAAVATITRAVGAPCRLLGLSCWAENGPCGAELVMRRAQ